jgi:hypothetical protein
VRRATPEDVFDVHRVRMDVEIPVVRMEKKLGP